MNLRENCVVDDQVVAPNEWRGRVPLGNRKTAPHEHVPLRCDPAQLQSHFAEVLKWWDGERNIPILLVAVTGLPGGGKGTVETELRNTGMQVHGALQQVRTPADMFLRTERDSRERATMHRDQGTFWPNYIDYPGLRDTASQIITADGHAADIHLPRRYDHAVGKIKPSVISMEDGRKLVFAEGVGTLAALRGLPTDPRFAFLGIAIQTNPHDAFARKVARDLEKGVRTRAQAEHMAERETGFILPLVNQEIQAADLVVTI